MKPITILCICGSLRAKSSNRALLAAAAKLAPTGTQLTIVDSIGTLPIFNPDLADSVPDTVLGFRKSLAAADAILVASPEYAHGVTGVMKNALDWVVGSGEVSGKPVAVVNASYRSFHAHESLMEIIRTMDAKLIPEASIRVPLASQHMTEVEISQDPELVRLLMEVLSQLIKST